MHHAMKLAKIVSALQYCTCAVSVNVPLRIVSEILGELYNLEGLLHTLLIMYLHKVRRRVLQSTLLS